MPEEIKEVNKEVALKAPVVVSPKKKNGRPKKTLNDLPKDWENIVLKEMGEGASKVEIRAALGVSDDLFDRLVKEDAQFSRTIKKGLALAEAWWQTKGRKNLENRNFSAVLWYMNMKNRFGWKDKTETDLTSKGDPIGIIYLPTKPKE